MHRLLIAVALTAITVLAPGAAFAARSPSTDARVSDAVFDRSSAIVVLKSLPVATYDGRIQGYERTKPTRGKLNPNSAAAQKYKSYLSAEHVAFQKWLQRNVPSAKITSEYFVTLNAVAVKLNGAAKGKLLNSDVVKSVEYVTRYYPTMSESYKHINARAAWQLAGGRSNAGEGVKIGVLDTGIDANHPFFDPTGFEYPDEGGPWPKCDAISADRCAELTSEKVIVAKVFSNQAAKNGWDAAPDDNDHGTHVAGTAAGVTGKTAVVEGVPIDDMSGIAPGAWLGNYKVLLGEEGSGRSEDIVNGVEEAVKDGMDVLNLSLGGGYRGNNDLMAMALDNAVAAGVVVVSTAGNNGPGPFTIGSPGRARDIITVGASTNDHFVGQPISYAGDTARAAVGDFGSLDGGTYDLVFLTGANANGCAAITPAVPAADDTLVVLDRGVCSFSQKVFNAEQAGADGVIVINNVAGDPTAMGLTAGIETTIPAVMISKDDGAALRAADPDEATVAATFDEFDDTGNEDILAGFSSQGPTFVNFDIKPDVTSVGVNVLSSVPCWMAEEGASCGGEGTWAFFNGTSMAAPHVAGSAAVLLELNPSWTPARVKSAIVNTADRVVTDAFDGDHPVGPLLQGAGRQDLTEAARSTVSLFPTSAAFGKISGSQNRPTSMTITLTNSANNAITFEVDEMRFNPSTFSAETDGIATHASTFGAGTIVNGDSRISTPAQVTVPANGTATLRVTVNAPASGLIQGWLDLDGPNGSDYSIAYAAVAP